MSEQPAIRDDDRTLAGKLAVAAQGSGAHSLGTTLSRQLEVADMDSRRQFLMAMTGSAAALALGRRDSGNRRSPPEGPIMDATEENTRHGGHGGPMPVLFVGHGSPMNVVEDNRWSRGFAPLRKEVPRPKAILAVSAHWFVDGTFLTGNPEPRTIHDFSGFPRELYEADYPAPGKLDLAGHVRTLLGEERASLSTDWGLDHGTWSVLKWMYPAADIPVIQLSINRRLDVKQHYALGQSLADLRDEGVLILGSGNAVHNLRDAFKRMQAGSDETSPWARRFDDRIAESVVQRDTSALLSAWPDTDDGRLAHPSPDHWLPLVYAFARLRRWLLAGRFSGREHAH